MMRRNVLGLMCLTLCMVPLANAAIMSIDFGSRNIKTGMVQKGKPFHIVSDETSKRKSDTVVAFEADGERRFGAGAKSLLVRKPQNSFEKMRDLLGASFDSPAVRFYNDGQYPHDLKASSDGRGMLSVEANIAGNTTELSIEQIVAMSLEYIQSNCEADAEEPVVDAVITVPGYWGHKERQAMLDAGELAGLNVLSLINENTAAAVQYGIDLNYKANETETLAIYNMGDTATQVSIVKYTAYTKRRGLSNKTIGQLEIIGFGYDQTLGGEAFDRILVDHMAKEFDEVMAKKGESAKSRDMPRVMAKLRKYAAKAKHVLSANTEVPLWIESLGMDIDYKSHLTRKAFYAMAEPILARVAKPLEDAMAKAGVQPSDLKTTLVIGGSVRIPAVAKTLKEVLKSDDALGYSLDGDEAVALGAAFMAANMSIAFRVRPIGLVDKATMPISIEIKSPPRDGKETTDDQEAVEPAEAFQKSAALFPLGSRLNSKKAVNFAHDRDFTVTVAYKKAKEGEEGPTGSLEERGLSVFNITGVAKALSKASMEPEKKPKIHLSFKMTSSGLVELAKAEISIQKKKAIKPKSNLYADNKTYSRCEAHPEEDGGNATCGACSHYATGCTTFSKCQKNDPSAKKDDILQGMKFPLFGANCSWRAKDNDSEAGCYHDTLGFPCYQLDNSTEKEDSSSNATNTDAKADDSDATKKEGEDTTSDSSGSESEKTETGATEETDKTDKDAEGDKPTKDSQEEEPKFKIVWVRKSLRSKHSLFGVQKGLSRSQLRDEQSILKALTAADQLKKDIAVSKNNLESYVYKARGLLRDEVGEMVTSEEEREGLIEALEAIEDWLYEQDEADDSVDKFVDKKADIQNQLKLVEHRAAEFEARPMAIEKCREVATSSEKWVSILSNRSWVSESDTQGLRDRVSTFLTWVDDMEAKQAETPLTEPPVFNTSMAYSKLGSVIKAAQRLLGKKKPKPPPKPLDYKRCETGKNKTLCGRCTHYASGCYTFDSCKSNNTRYALYGKSKCYYSKDNGGCFYSSSSIDYPCFKGVPKKANSTKEAKASTNSTESAEQTAAPTEGETSSEDQANEEGAGDEETADNKDEL